MPLLVARRPVQATSPRCLPASVSTASGEAALSPAAAWGLGGGADSTPEQTFRVFFLLPRFALQGYLTQGTGKIYHTEEGGSTPPWDGGDGMPPNQDPPSWTPGGADGRPNSMSDVNAVAPMVGCGAGTVRHFPEGCGINATLEGVVPPGVHALCDKVIGDDALAKLEQAAANQARPSPILYQDYHMLP